jgi:integrative and conjugative element protein (TIGR02256 family)
MKEGITINNELVFIVPTGKTLFIRPEALEKMISFRQSNMNDTEAGGILIGRILLENEHYIIDDVTIPMLNDNRKRTRFSRKSEGHQEYFDSIFQREQGTCYYLGEWHTHPERIPNPSYIDKKDWKRILGIGFESDNLFFIIIGIDKIKVWWGNVLSYKIEELKRRGLLGDE